MKYESSILKRLIDVYGVVGNPRYISEIIKQFIVQGKECYPDLFTYQSDWLAHIDEFGLTPEYTVSYTGQHIYAPNTKEKPVKRAILKGSTKYRDIDTGEFLETFEEGRNLELVSVKMPVLTTTGKRNFVFEKDKTVDMAYGTISNSPNDIGEINFLTIPSEPFIITGELSWKTIAFYDENKTFISALRKSTVKEDLVVNTSDMPSNTKYFRFGGHFSSYGTYESVIPTIKVTTISGDIIYDYLSSDKTNILTVNEDVTLRGIGDVQDTLDCLTGQVTERIGEIVFDGSENWSTYFTTEDTISFIGSTIADAIDKQYNSTNLMCDKLVVSGYGAWTKANNITLNTKSFSICVLKSSLETADVNGFKKWLAENLIKVQYVKSNESVKTVDLTIHDKDQQKVERLTSFVGGTHFTTSSQEGSLLPTLTVDVVTNLEETLKVCSLEGNTM